MIYYKTNEDVEGIRQSCLLVSKTLAEAAKYIKPGVTTLELNRIIDEFIRDHKGYPAFLGYRDFPKSACISVNDQVVHGIPNEYEIREGDIVSVDCGVLLDGYYGDSAYTFGVGEINSEMKRLLSVTKESLDLGVQQARIGKRIGDIASSIQEYVQSKGFSVVRELVGHGLGKSLHEDPEVPNYGKRGQGTKIQEGLVIAIEPMVNMGKKEVYTGSDHWTVFTIDGKPSAHFEHTVAVKKSGPEILTTFEFIEEPVYGMAV